MWQNCHLFRRAIKTKEALLTAANFCTYRYLSCAFHFSASYDIVPIYAITSTFSRLQC